MFNKHVNLLESRVDSFDPYPFFKKKKKLNLKRKTLYPFILTKFLFSSQNHTLPLTLNSRLPASDFIVSVAMISHFSSLSLHLSVVSDSHSYKAALLSLSLSLSSSDLKVFPCTPFPYLIKKTKKSDLKV